MTDPSRFHPEQVSLIGRNELLSRALSDLDAGRGVILTGPPGIGKTRMLKAIADRLEQESANPLNLRATRSASSIPFGIFLSVGGVAASGVANAGAFGAADHIRRSILESRHRAVLVDDAHLIDDPSAGVLLELQRSGVPIVAATRRGWRAPDAIAALVDVGVREQMELAPLDVAQTRQFVEESLSGVIDPVVTKEVHSRVGGYPLFIRELLDALVRSGTLVERRGSWRLETPLRIPTGSGDLVLDRVSSLSTAGREVVDLVAIAETLRLDQLLQTTSPLAVEEAEERGLVMVDRGTTRLTVRLHHPIYREALLREGPESGRLTEARFAIEVTEDVRAADDILTRGYDAALLRGDRGTRTQFAFLLGCCRLLQGEVNKALTYAAASDDRNSGVWARANRARILCARAQISAAHGDLDAAEDYLDEARETPYAPYHRCYVDTTDASINRERAPLRTVARALVRVGHRAATSGNRTGSRAAWYLAARYGDDEAAGLICRDLQGAAQPSARMKLAHANAWSRRSARGLMDAGHGLRQLGLRSYAVDALAQAVICARENEGAESVSVILMNLSSVLAECPGLSSPVVASLGSVALLTRREEEVARFAASGLSDREIAVRLRISVRTVSTHLTHVYAKFGVPGRSSLRVVLDPHRR